MLNIRSSLLWNTIYTYHLSISHMFLMQYVLHSFFSFCFSLGIFYWVYIFLYILYSSPFMLFVYCDQSIAKPNPSGFNIRYCSFFQVYSVHLIFYSINSILDYILILSSISSFLNFLLNIYHNYFKVIAC